MDSKNLNLYQKLVQVRKEVKYVQKAEKGYNFQYATEPQILGAIRSKMDELNLFLEVNMDGLESVTCSIVRDKSVVKIDGLKACFSFTWTNADNPTETITKKMIMQDIEQGIETVGGLLTYANRYFLYKFFSVPTDKEDPDAFDNKIKKTFESKPSEDNYQGKPVEIATNQYVTIKEVLDIEAFINENISPADPNYIKRALANLNSESISKLNRSQFESLQRNSAKKAKEIFSNKEKQIA